MISCRTGKPTRLMPPEPVAHLAGRFHEFVQQRGAQMKLSVFGLAACIAIGLSGTCPAQDLKAVQKFTDTQIGFDLTGPYSNLTLTVSGPGGIHASASSRSGSPLIDLGKLGKIDDGEYHYHLTAATDEK